MANSRVYREPIGVVVAISPWNYPLFLSMSKIIPALAAGCTVVHKLSEVTPLNSRPALMCTGILRGTRPNPSWLTLSADRKAAMMALIATLVSQLVEAAGVVVGLRYGTRLRRRPGEWLAEPISSSSAC